MPSQITNPPDGWTVDEGEMDTAFYWGADGEGTLAAQGVGLSNPAPQMIKSRNAGKDGYVFTCGDKCYLWNMILGDVYEYVQPADLEGILAEMNKPQGSGTVQRTLLPQT